MCGTTADDVAPLVELEMLKEVAESSKGMGEFAMISAMPGIANYKATAPRLKLQ